MPARLASSRAIDASALTLSGLCLVHCLALPLIAAFLPLAGAWAEDEWVHKVLVLLAVPISVFAIARSFGQATGYAFIGLALTGLALLTAAAFVETLHDLETPLTVCGALILASAHIWRWTRHARA